MPDKYSKLVFDNSQIGEWIKYWCEKNLEGTFEIKVQDTPQRIAYTIINDTREIKIDFIKAKGGALTIYPKVGKEIETSELIAEDIYQRVCGNLTKSPFAHGISLKMDYEDFETLINFLKEYDDISIENYSKVDEPGKATYEQYRLKSVLKDSVVVKYYNNTNRLQIQGKPLYLFNEITSLICESEENASSVVDAHIELCSLNIKRDDLDEELKSILGVNVYNFMTVSHRAMISSSIVLSKVKIDGLDDYSYIIQQALRTYEGFALKMMAAKGCVLPSGKQIGEFFGRASKGDPFTMKSKYSSGLSASNISLFESMYNFCHSKRNPYMHSSDNDATTAVIETFEGAVERLEEIINSIKSSFSVL